MKKILSALALAAIAVGANAQVSYTGGTPTAIADFNPNAPSTVPVQTAGLLNPIITVGTGGTLTATFLGYEALDTDTYAFILNTGASSLTITNNTATPNVTFVSGLVSPSNFNFTFRDMTTGNSVSNGGLGNGGSGIDSYAVLGSFQGAVFTPYRGPGNAYDLVLGFNDGLRVDGDFDDLIIGLRITPVPEPETYALLLAGLGAVGFMSRRRRKFVA